MSDFIEEFYYGNIEPQECTTNLTAKVKKSLSELSGKEEHQTSLLTDKEQELFTDYVETYIKFSSLCNADTFTVGFRLGARFTFLTNTQLRKKADSKYAEHSLYIQKPPFVEKSSIGGFQHLSPYCENL